MPNKQNMWKFKPILKTTIWGGDRIIPFKGLDIALSDVGESWEISGVPGAESVVESGPDAGMTLSDLIDKYDARLLGERNLKKFGRNFPLLIKFINSRHDLSVQVHPDDELAAMRGYPFGKNEMWYIVETGKDARIASGFTSAVDPDDYDRLVESGNFKNVLRYFSVHPGEVYFIPAGRVHAICGNCLLMEVQQTSDVTYRIYDYKRKDKNGKERELHTELAREAINFADTGGKAVDYRQLANIPVNVIRSPFFCVNVLDVDTSLMRDYSESDTFVILICTAGQADISCGQETVRLTAGHTLLIPASATGIGINPSKNVSLIETYIQ